MSRGNANKSNTDELLWVIVFLFVGIIALWYFGHEKISTVVMSLRRFEASLILFDADGRLALIEWLSSTHPADATPKSLWSSGIVASRELRWYVLAILTGVFAYLMYRAPDRGNRYSNKHTTVSLAKQESSQWPVILPALETDFIALPLNHSVHGMRAKVRDYARRHQFLVRTAALGEKEDPADIELLDNKEALKLSRARVILVAQLGKPWEGVDALKPYERSLFAAFAAQMNHDNDLALKIINELARAYVRAKRAKKIALLNSLHAKRALHQYANTKVVKRVVSRYAYKRTVLMGMKAAASANGVLAPNWFRWLKAVDRVTWYSLCDIGMDVASVEACGLRSHWLSEVVAKSAIMNPRIDAALVGIKVALGEMVDEESDD